MRPTRHSEGVPAVRLRELALALGLMLVISGCDRAETPVAAGRPPVVVVGVTNVESRAGVLHLKGRAEPFTGLLREWHTNGLVKAEASFRDGRLDGPTRGFHPNGSPQVEESFTAGVADGVRRRFYENGSLMSREEILDGRLHGRYERFHPNGQPAEKGAYVRGEPEGTAESWDASGQPMARVRFESGKVVEQVFLSAAPRGPAAASSVHD